MDTPNLTETWTLRKPVVVGDGGLVSSQHYRASQVGAQVLREGGNAVDAAVATSLAVGVLEPWMSGLGGGGQMLVHLADEGRTLGLDFGMLAPLELDPRDYPLVEGSGADLFNWPAVLEDRNLRGYHSMAVPGYVSGVSTALQRYGTRSWAQCLEPAIGLAEQGMEVDWYATLKIASSARLLAGYPESRRLYLPDGFPPCAQWAGPAPVISLGRLAATLRRLAEAGADDFYTGELAAEILADVREGGSPLAAEDLATYRTNVREASVVRYRDALVQFSPGLTAGPSLRQALGLLENRWTAGEKPDAGAFEAYAACLLETYVERLSSMGDCDEEHDPSSTTHISVVDRHGNLVALTQTLLSVFGSKVVLPRTGILMNNGIMWFDPRAGFPNSIRPGRRPLSNVCPAMVLRDDGLCVALGAAGGRRIFPSVMQLISFLVDFRMTLEEAAHQPRVDVSGTDLVTVDSRMPPSAAKSLGVRFRTRFGLHGVHPSLFGCPGMVSRELRTGRCEGTAFVPSPWAGVAAI